MPGMIALLIVAAIIVIFVYAMRGQTASEAPSDTPAPIITQPIVTDPISMPTPAEIVNINNPTKPVPPVVVQPVPAPTPIPVPTPIPTPTPPVVVQPAPIPTPAPTLPQSPITAIINWCTGGIYCNGQGIPESASKVGAVVCGANNYKYTCTQPDPKVAPSWITDKTTCATGLPGRCSTSVPAPAPVPTPPPTPAPAPTPICTGGIYCNGQGIPASASKLGAVVCGANNYKFTCTQPDPKVAPSWKTDLKMCATGLPGRCADRLVVYGNNGDVSGNKYCGGINKAPWNNELPVSWNGAKCISAGYNGVNGVGCDVVPGRKAGFMVLCTPTNKGWN